MVEQPAALVLRWSRWRCWHQAWARFYHQRRQQHKHNEPVPLQEQRVSELATEAWADRDDEIEVVWKRLEPLLPPQKRSGRPYDYTRRLVLEAIVYVMQTDCGWRHLPAEFPPWQTVYAQYTHWRKTGVWDTIWAGLAQPKPLPI